MTSKGFYSVVNGFHPGIYTNWAEVKIQVEGYKGARWRKFPHVEDAQRWFNAQTKPKNSSSPFSFEPQHLTHLNIQEPDEDVRHCWTKTSEEMVRDFLKDIGNGAFVPSSTVTMSNLPSHDAPASPMKPHSCISPELNVIGCNAILVSTKDMHGGYAWKILPGTFHTQTEVRALGLTHPYTCSQCSLEGLISLVSNIGMMMREKMIEKLNLRIHLRSKHLHDQLHLWFKQPEKRGTFSNRKSWQFLQKQLTALPQLRITTFYLPPYNTFEEVDVLMKLMDERLKQDRRSDHLLQSDTESDSDADSNSNSDHE
jgi:hypothetical protein